LQKKEWDGTPLQENNSSNEEDFNTFQPVLQAFFGFFTGRKTIFPREKRFSAVFIVRFLLSGV